MLLFEASGNYDDEYNAETRIVGGIQSEVGRYPYMAALIEDRIQYCGGALVAPGWVLSAAHCKGSSTHVIIGRVNLGSTKEVYETIPIDYEIDHPNYNTRTNEHDIMLIRLIRDSKKTPVRHDDGSLSLATGSELTVMGWGATCYNGPQSSRLLEANVGFVSRTKCNMQYSGAITSDMLCAAGDGKDACQGDSGGPLIQKGSSFDNDVLVGLVSWGNGCADSDFSGVYTNIAAHKDWIESYLSGNRIFTDSDRKQYNSYFALKSLIHSWNRSKRKKKNGLRNFNNV